MNAQEKLFKEIDKIDDRFLMEACEYKRSRKTRNLKILVAAAACICACVILSRNVGNVGNPSGGNPVSVIAYAGDEKIRWQRPTILQGTIDDDGDMHGAPLRFYISGNSIESIRFSCKNEELSFMNWNENAKDNYGYGKNFTVDYSEEKNYRYLTIDWEPDRIIRKLTDHEDIDIRDLSQEEREDIIVLQVTYKNGEKETQAISIHLSDSGNFEARSQKYRITAKDTFVQRKDSPLTHDGPVRKSEKGKAAGKYSYSDIGSGYSAAAGNAIKCAKKYYESLNYFVDIQDIYPADSRQAKADPDWIKEEKRSYEKEGYTSDQIMVLEVKVRKQSQKRYVTVGSKDGWKDCKVLNEGY